VLRSPGVSVLLSLSTRNVQVCTALNVSNLKPNSSLSKTLTLNQNNDHSYRVQDITEQARV
jgi:hypothetical protein